MVVDLDKVDKETAIKYGMPEGDFVLGDKNAMEAMERLGLKSRDELE